MRGFIEFEFDLPGALLARLIEILESMDEGVLTAGNVAQIPDAQGVYQLLLDGELVYIGKTDAEAGLQHRLRRHSQKVQHRKNLVPSRVTFKAVRILVFTAMDLETQLIKHYRKNRPVPWNGSGFGSNDPGRRRETTGIAPDGYDASHPIDIDYSGDFVPNGDYTAAEALTRLKAALPYTLRFETERDARGRANPHKPLPELKSALVHVPSAPQTTRQLLETIIVTIPSGWQATEFVSHVILYKEKRSYAHGTIVASSS